MAKPCRVANTRSASDTVWLVVCGIIYYYIRKRGMVSSGYRYSIASFLLSLSSVLCVCESSVIKAMSVLWGLRSGGGRIAILCVSESGRQCWLYIGLKIRRLHSLRTLSWLSMYSLSQLLHLFGVTPHAEEARARADQRREKKVNVIQFAI
jgi:hypothetical protein